MFDLSLIVGFDWDGGNARKNEKHGVNQSEAEEVFFNQPLLLLDDSRHGGQESRFHAVTIPAPAQKHGAGMQLTLTPRRRCKGSHPESRRRNIWETRISKALAPCGPLWPSGRMA